MTQPTTEIPRPSAPSAGAPPADHATRPPYLAAALAAAAVFALYAITLAPTTAFWDTSEYIATAHILGIPHPPGNPVFVMLARAWELLLAPLGLSVAVRVNLFSAVMSAGASFFWFLVVHRVLSAFTAREGVRRAGAAVSIVIAATAFTVWNQSNVNEKVYTVSLFTIAALSWIAFLWRDHVEEHRGEGPRGRWHDDNALVLMAFILALSVGNHLMAFLAAPALLVFVLLVKPRVLLNWRLYVFAALFGVLGLSAHLFLPIRANLDPIINEAAPQCASMGDALASVVTMGNGGCEELNAALQREQYQKPPLGQRQAPFGAQLLNYFQYFDWQWARSIQGRTGYLAPGRLPVTLLFLVLGAIGAWRHWVHERKSFWYVAILFGTLSVGLTIYLNFKYGYMQVYRYGLSQDLSEVRERDYFFLVSFSLWGLWAGVGLTAVWLWLMDGIRDARRAPLIASPILLVALIPLVLNWPYASRRGDYAARDWAYNVLQSVEPYGVLFTNGDNDTFPLWYLQEVEGVRRDVTVIVMSYLNTGWYAKQLRDLTRPCGERDWREHPTRITCQRDFDPAGAPAFYGDPDKPTRSILDLDDEQIEANAYPYYLPQDVVFEARGIRTTLPRGMPIQPADQFALTMIKSAWGDRPFHFATTTNAHRRLGLAPFTARQGFAYRLVTPDEVRDEKLVPMPQNDPYSSLYGQWLHADRHRELLDDVFVYRGLEDRAHWVDDATRNIPAYYAYANIAAATAEAQLGNDELAQRRMDAAQNWSELADER